MARELKLSLRSPGMTTLHRAGLGGLYMTLKDFEDREVKIPGLDWEKDKTSVTLRFRGETVAEAFNALTREAFRIDEQGFFDLPGLTMGSPVNIGYKYHLYEALKGTFLQFGPHCESEAKKTITYEIDDKTFYIRDFAPLKSYKHQNAAGEFLNGKGNFREMVDIKGWLFPGGVERHVGVSNTGLSEPPELALCLLFAPIGVIYYRIQSVSLGSKARMAMVIPDVEDLEEYLGVREEMLGQDVLSLVVSGPTDAALKYLLAEKVRKSVKKVFSQAQIERCTVVCFGTVSWNKKQKTRTYITRISQRLAPDLNTYALADSIFKNRWQLVQAKEAKGVIVRESYYFAKVPTARELVAGNCVLGKPWYNGISDALANKEVREQLLFEREGFSAMLDKSEIGEKERNFVLVCQESWRRRMGQLGQRARKENVDFGSLASRERERLRSTIIRCKNAESLREVVVDFWSKAGPLEILQEHWSEVMQLFDHSDWKKARDLALLALISYKPSSTEEKEVWISTDERGDEE